MKNTRRVVITGLGVVAPNGVGIPDFMEALRMGKSGIRHIPDLADKQFACRIGGIPHIPEELPSKYFSTVQLRSLRSSNIIYGCIAGVDAWRDAGLELNAEKEAEPDWNSGTIFGAGLPGVETWKHCIYQIDANNVRRLGGGNIEQGMASGVSAYLGGMLGLGNQVSTNAAACSTGTEAILMACDRIRLGRADRMVAGSAEGGGPYVWGAFDSMRILQRKSNELPEKASRPLSASARGFVPGAGAGALVLEDLETAQKRNARIYAEVLGGSINSGGQRNGGSMTAPNPLGMMKCIESAIRDSEIHPNEIDVISGHLTATMGDPLEVDAWTRTLQRSHDTFPYIHSLKSMIGHCLSAAGSIETVAAVLQLYHDFIHPSLNCEDLHPAISSLISPDCIPADRIDQAGIRTFAKASFGFGDVNSCLILRKWD